MKKIYYSGAGIILWHKDKDGVVRIALQKRQPFLKYGGKWSIAGGKKEQGESFCRAACRELGEEMKVLSGYEKPRLNEFIFSGFYNFVTFKAQVKSEVPPVLIPQRREVSECGWFKLNELPSDLCLPARWQIFIFKLFSFRVLRRAR